MACDRLNAARFDDEPLNHPPEQEHELAGRGVAGLGDDGVGRQLTNDRRAAPPRQLPIVELVEQIDCPELLERRSLRLAHALARYSWISETAIEPSPTALATRLMERVRTSPATNTPGTLVSST